MKFSFSYFLSLSIAKLLLLRKCCCSLGLFIQILFKDFKIPWDKNYTGVVDVASFVGNPVPEVLRVKLDCLIYNVVGGLGQAFFI